MVLQQSLVISVIGKDRHRYTYFAVRGIRIRIAAHMKPT